MYDIIENLKRVEKEIEAFEKKEILTGKILFYGNSLFTRWGGKTWGYRRLDEDIRAKDGSIACVNHGFGGSTSEDLLYYYHRAVRPWAPKALVLASFANDWTFGTQPEEVMANLGKICAWARQDFPGIRFFLVQDHPRPSRIYDGPAADDHVNYFNLKNRQNEVLEMYAATHEDTQIIRLWDVPELFETPEDVGNFRKVRKELYHEDKVHPNQAGYDVLAPVFRQALDDLV